MLSPRDKGRGSMQPTSNGDAKTQETRDGAQRRLAGEFVYQLATEIEQAVLRRIGRPSRPEV